jgi:hypothetical protein
MFKYIISESQFNQLIQKKKKDKKIAETIISKSQKFNSLNESLNNNAVRDLLESYKRKGLLNKSIIKILMKSEYIKNQLK